jgi:hypothetical protein
VEKTVFRIRTKTCDNCDCSEDVPGVPGILFCQLNPPTVVYQHVPDGRGGLGIVHDSLYPRVKLKDFCGSHVLIPNLTNGTP